MSRGASARALRRAAALLPGILILSLTPTAIAQPSVTIERDVPYAEGDGARTLDAFIPVGEGPFPAVIFVHGGAWTGGDKSGLAAPANQVAQRGWVGITINYRLAPPRWPTQAEDVRAAIGFVRDQAERFRVDPKAIAVLGASAGANLALLVGVTGEGPLTDGVRVRAVVSWSGPTDLEALALDPRGSSCSEATCARRGEIPPTLEGYIGCPVTACPEDYRSASPLNHVDPSDPPILLANGIDELVPSEQATDMAARLSDEGVPSELIEVPGAAHGTEYGQDVWPQTLAFLDRWLHELPSPPPGVATSERIPTVGLVIAAVALVALAGGALLVRSRRRRTG